MEVLLFNLHQHKTNVLSFKLGNSPLINNSDGCVCMCVYVCVCMIFFQYFVWSEKKRVEHKVNAEHCVLSFKSLIQTMQWHFRSIIDSKNHYQLLLIRMMSCFNASFMASQPNIYPALFTSWGNRYCIGLIFLLSNRTFLKISWENCTWNSWFIVCY